MFLAMFECEAMQMIRGFRVSFVILRIFSNSSPAMIPTTICFMCTAQLPLGKRLHELSAL